MPFDSEAAVQFARLRAAHPALRPPDAIQLACALAGHCDLFLTNDERLSALSRPGRLVIQSLGTWYAEHVRRAGKAQPPRSR